MGNLLEAVSGGKAWLNLLEVMRLAHADKLLLVNR